MVRLGTPEASDPTLVGYKAARLSIAVKAGFPVPSGLCITTDTYRDFSRQCGLEKYFAAIEGCRDNPSALLELSHHIAEVFASEELPPQVREELHRAFAELARASPQGTVAVRSSATVEDLSRASFAGQAATFLGVNDDELEATVKRCWASLWSPQAVAYRIQKVLPAPEMGVLIQPMLPSELAGVAFTRDPLSGEKVVVIEAVQGLGESLVSGRVRPVRYVWKGKGAISSGDPDAPITPAQLDEIASMALSLEELFGEPQDVEWCYYQSRLYLLQSRPLTTESSLRRKAWEWFNEPCGDNGIWTSGFFNERFSEPLSPLGWSIIKALVEELAFRDPLRYMGFPNPETLPITRLYYGRPYVNLRVFQMLYKPFPDFLLPEGVKGYFPNRDAAIRKEAPFPPCVFHPYVLLSLLRHFLRDPRNWSPFHNYRLWREYLGFHRKELASIKRMLESTPDGDLSGLWELMERVQALNRKLLSIHRWSLVWADVTLALLERFLSIWMSGQKAADLSARLLLTPGNRTLEMGKALREIAHGKESKGALKRFLGTYGHRSFSLDIYHPTFAEAPSQVLELASQFPGRIIADERAFPGRDPLQGLPLPLRAVTRLLANWARHYALLREEQRHHWQESLALMRRIALSIGRAFARWGKLAAPSDVFFLTWEELKGLCTEESHGNLHNLASARRQVFEELSHLDARVCYPLLLQGDSPLEGQGVSWDGIPVSPGIARGPARILLTPMDLKRVRPGDVLIARSLDPAWTIVFDRVVALVMEAGGQLSHGAVVAREYGIPAVTGVQGITLALKDDDEVMVDGYRGKVSLPKDKPHRELEVI